VFVTVRYCLPLQPARHFVPELGVVIPFGSRIGNGPARVGGRKEGRKEDEANI
jgi:hypothetical protein